MAQQRSTTRKPRSSSASRRTSSKKRSPIPGWAWLIAGLLVGVFAAFLIVLTRFDSSSLSPTAKSKEPAAPTVPHKSATADSRTKPADSKTKPTATPSKSEAAKEKSAINYDFYKILPQYEVVVSEEEASKPAAATAGTYYLQVGAFRQMAEADSHKAELALLGIISSIQTVTIEGNNTWHRVRIGPVTDMRQLDRTKRQLQENNIAFVTLKEKS